MEQAILYNHIPVAQSTFKAGLAAKIHRWFRLTPSFGPDLVCEMLNKLDCKNGNVVLDPFSGASTTLIESALQGYDSYGFEINPFLHWVGTVSLRWNIDKNELTDTLNGIVNKFEEDSLRINFDNLADNNLEIPKIHNPLRWWRKDVLTSLLILKNAIKTQSGNKDVQEFFLLALAGVLIPDLTNVTLGRLQLHFIIRDDDFIDTINIFKKHALTMIKDVSDVQQLENIGDAKLFNIDSLNPNIDNFKPINCVITSPPYPNRYSYVWNTRPYLYFFDFFNSPKQASELDKSTIGGTWGTATSVLSKGIVSPEFQFLEEIVVPVTEQIRIEDNLMANYVIKYFNLLAAQIHAMEKLPQNNLRCAYVVGNSRVKGVYVETDVILAKIFSELGYRIESVERIRKRHSGKDLHESIVYAFK